MNARLFRLYRFYDETGRLLYVGQTGRQPLVRLLEHVRDQPWHGQMARWEVDRRIWHTEGEVLEAEKATIRAECPVHNVAHNGVRHSWARPGVWRQPPRAGRVAGRRPEPSAWTLRLAGVVAVWLGVAVAVWWVVAGRVGGGQAVELAVVVASLVVGWPVAVWALRRARARWRRVWR